MRRGVALGGLATTMAGRSVYITHTYASLPYVLAPAARRMKRSQSRKAARDDHRHGLPPGRILDEEAEAHFFLAPGARQRGKSLASISCRLFKTDPASTEPVPSRTTGPKITVRSTRSLKPCSSRCERRLRSYGL